MAKNRVYPQGKIFKAGVPVGTVSGSPVLVGASLTGVALIDRQADGTATIQRNGAYDLTVKAIDGVGSNAVVEGDQIYYVLADTPPLSKKATGVPFGKAILNPFRADAAGATLLVAGATGIVTLDQN